MFIPWDESRQRAAVSSWSAVWSTPDNCDSDYTWSLQSYRDAPAAWTYTITDTHTHTHAFSPSVKMSTNTAHLLQILIDTCYEHSRSKCHVLRPALNWSLTKISGNMHSKSHPMPQCFHLANLLAWLEPLPSSLAGVWLRTHCYPVSLCGLGLIEGYRIWHQLSKNTEAHWAAMTSVALSQTLAKKEHRQVATVSRGVAADLYTFNVSHCTNPHRDGQAELT